MARVIFIAVASVIFLCSCGKEPPLKNYYMPSMVEGEKKVIVYESTNILKNTQFWLVEKEQGGYNVSVFDDEGRLIQKSRDSITLQGIVQESSEIQWRDSSGKNIIYVEQSIIHGGLFPYDPMDSLHAYVYCVEWQASDQGYELCRNRRYLGTHRVNLGNEQLDCAIFMTSEVYSDEKGGYLEVQTDGVEYYSENRGLVLRRKFVTSILKSGQRQVNILGLEAFRDLYPEIKLES